MGFFDRTTDISRNNFYTGYIKGLWMTPVGHFLCTLPNRKKIQETIKKLAYLHKNESEKNIETNVSSKIKQNLYETKFNFLNCVYEDDEDNKNLNELKQWFKLCINDYYHLFFDKKHKNLNEIRIKESWAHITNNNGYHGPHMHPNCSICGNFYIDIGESNIRDMNGVNCFFSPVSSDMSIDGFDYYNTAETVNPENLKLTLFPPNILHNSTPYNGNNDRIILAFNALYGNSNIEFIP